MVPTVLQICLLSGRKWELTSYCDELGFGSTPVILAHICVSFVSLFQVVDKHLSILAKEHLETKFVKLDAEKSPFLCERLRIFMLPTIAIIKNGKAEDYVVGFDELGGSDDFGTEVLEERLARTGVIFADGLGGDGASRRKAKGPSEEKRSIRKGGAQDDGSDDDDE